MAPKTFLESVFYGQVYDLHGFGFDVPKLTQWCADHLIVRDIPLSALTMSRSDEKHGSEEFKQHVAAVDHKTFPIVTLRRKEGNIQIVDGNHRAWKAADMGENTIQGYIIPDEEMLPYEALVYLPKAD